MGGWGMGPEGGKGTALGWLGCCRQGRHPAAGAAWAAPSAHNTPADDASPPARPPSRPPAPAPRRSVASRILKRTQAATLHGKDVFLAAVKLWSGMDKEKRQEFAKEYDGLSDEMHVGGGG
jgi:hypothetical protein